MKIYFAGSIRAGREDAAIYAEMIGYLQSFGEVLTEHVGDRGLSAKGDDGGSDRCIHDRDMNWLASCDLVIAEVTVPSLGVGYELGFAVSLKKPVLCLYRVVEGRLLSAMIAGSPGIRTVAYSSTAEAKAIMKKFISEAACKTSNSAGSK